MRWNEHHGQHIRTYGQLCYTIKHAELTRTTVVRKLRRAARVSCRSFVVRQLIRELIPGCADDDCGLPQAAGVAGRVPTGACAAAGLGGRAGAGTVTGVPAPAGARFNAEEGSATETWGLATQTCALGAAQSSFTDMRGLLVIQRLWTELSGTGLHMPCDAAASFGGLERVRQEKVITCGGRA